MGIIVLDGQSPANVLSIIKLRTFYTRERAALYLTASMEPYVSHLGTTSNNYIITRLTLEIMGNQQSYQGSNWILRAVVFIFWLPRFLIHYF